MSHSTTRAAEDVVLQATHFEVLGTSDKARVTYRLMHRGEVLGEICLHVERTAFKQRQAAVRRALKEFADLLQKGVDKTPPRADQ